MNFTLPCHIHKQTFGGIFVQNQIKFYRKISIDRPGGIHLFLTHNFWIIHKRTKIKTYWKSGNFSIRIYFYHCFMTSGSEHMSRKKVNTPWYIYRVFTVIQNQIKFVQTKKKAFFWWANFKKKSHSDGMFQYFSFEYRCLTNIRNILRNIFLFYY